LKVIKDGKERAVCPVKHAVVCGIMEIEDAAEKAAKGIMTLYDAMFEIADRDKLPEDHLMRIKATELKEVVEGKEMPTPKRLLGAWARARRAYCDYTGTPLVDPAAVETGARLMTFLSEFSKGKK
jgi:hypothetical protein